LRGSTDGGIFADLAPWLHARRKLGSDYAGSQMMIGMTRSVHDL